MLKVTLKDYIDPPKSFKEWEQIHRRLGNAVLNADIDALSSEDRDRIDRTLRRANNGENFDIPDHWPKLGGVDW